MEQAWISERRTLELPGLTLDRHLSAPNENVREPEFVGIAIYPNVVAAVLTIAITVTGYWLTGQAKTTERFR